MKFASIFHVYTGETDLQEGTSFIALTEFVTFLKSRDVNNKLIVSNVKRTLQSYSGGIKTINGQQSAPVASILRFCFHSADSIDACKFVCNVVQRELLCNKEATSISSSFELYKLIAKTQFRNFEFPCHNVVFDDKRIETLVKDHKIYFTSEEWNKICWFENQFSLSEDSLQQDFEKLIGLKYAKFQSILSFKDCCDKWLKIAENDIKKRKQRITLAEEIGRVEIRGTKPHYAYSLDNDIQLLLQDHLKEHIISVVAFDTVKSKENNTIQIVVQVISIDLNFDISDLCKIAYYEILKKHGLHIECAYFCSEECLKPFLEGNTVARFQLRDEIEVCNLACILYTWQNEEEIEDNTNSDNIDDSPCESCSFSMTSIKLLSLKGFDIHQEWFLETPIETQFLLESFVNRRSLKKASDKVSFLAQKLEKLFRLYDSLLNTYNRNYIGIFQQANANELLIEYKSVNSVFDVTSSAGATTSLAYAELNLKKHADEDLCYYKTYLQQHNLLFDSVTVGQKESVCLRECHLILMLDNLVRLKNADETTTSRGVRKSRNLCTLPITLQGLPTDSIITSQWHLPECDGTELCTCKNPVTLTKSDISRTLLELNPNEKKTYQQFVRLMTWCNSSLWDKLTDEILEYVDHDFVKIHENTIGFNAIQETIGEAQTEDTDQLPEDEDLVKILANLNRETASKYNNEARCENTTEKDKTSAINESSKRDDADMEKENTMRYDDDDYDDDDSDDDDVGGGGDDDNDDDDDDGGGGGDKEFERNFRLNEMEDDAMTDLERSMDQMSILEPESVLETTDNVQSLLASFGFSKFIVPPLLCRHPPPAVGRDDDIYITKQILDDTLKKMGYLASRKKCMNRILCGPDNKIGKSILMLMATDPKYKAFLVEFPLLYLRKSKITILFSAYQDAGIVEILQYMRDDKQDDWKRLVSVQHIDIATRHVKRIAASLHIAFLVVFTKSLPANEQQLFWNDMETGEASVIAECWAERFEDFLQSGSRVNATFALHVDMMRHCDHVVAIAFAERLGGPDGYDLVLAAVKESLRFSFVNNATSYAPYCVQLLYQHYGAGFFHQCLKTTLYTTPFKDSNRNFACDTKRELDHLDALKGFRSGSNITAVTSRMSLMDTLNEARDYRSGDKKKLQDTDSLGWGFTEVDQEHIFPTVALILRQGGLSLEESTTPSNVYSTPPILLPTSILDVNSDSAGEYLLYRYLVKEKMFNTTPADLPSQDTLIGSSELLARAKRSKGVTIKRTIKARVQVAKTESQLKEEERQKVVAKESQLIDLFSSSHNACQVIVKSDGSKAKVMKSKTMPKALRTLVDMCKSESNRETANKLILQNQTHIPQNVSAECTVSILEFAGVKFKLGNIQSGKEYIDHCERIIKGLYKKFPRLDTVVICEEKYHFTPDDFKAITREQRKSKWGKTVDHLKTASAIINGHSLNKDAVTGTMQGKIAISTFLAQNLKEIQMHQECKVIVDSELYLNSCDCQEQCTCEKYATPLLFTVVETDGKFVSQTEFMSQIRQRKGEAEMAVADWVIQFQDKLKPGEVVVSLISSADIDSVPIHLYAVSKYWIRDACNNFRNPVFVVLEKPRGGYDIYNITGMITLFESRFLDMNIGVKVALGLCLGGNDYVPKLYTKSHEVVLTHIISSPVLRNNLFVFGEDKIVLNQAQFAELFRGIYCPKREQKNNLSYQEVRALTIAKIEDKSFKGGYRTNDPRNWLPPETAMQRLGELVQLQIKYMETVGKHDAVNPDFLQYSVLQRNTSNEIVYDFGPESYFKAFEELPVPVTKSHRTSTSKQKAVTQTGRNTRKRPEKRQLDSTPQKGLRRKRPLTSTPKSKT